MASGYPGYKRRVDRFRTVSAPLSEESPALAGLAAGLADDLDQLGSAISASKPDLYIRYLAVVKCRLLDLRDMLHRQEDSMAAAPAAAPAVAERPFNSLTYLTIDPATRQVTYHGDVDPAGPQQPPPYAQLLAAAMRLPPESGPAGVTGSVPGFSLEPVQDVSGLQSQVMDRLRSLPMAEVQRLMQTDEASGVFLEQALPTIKINFWAYLVKKDSKLSWPNDLIQIQTPADLGAFTKKWSEAGLIVPQDRPSLKQIMVDAMYAPLSQPGSFIALPSPAFAQALHLHVTTHPTFYGIENDTELARAVLDADVALKTLTGPRGHRLAGKLPFHETLLQWEVEKGGTALVLSGAPPPMGIIQVVPGRFDLGLSADGTLITFDGAAMQINVSPRMAGEPVSPLQSSYAEFTTEHFDDYARQVAPLWNIREAYKIVAAARLLRARGIAVSLPELDTSWRAPVELESEWEFAGVGLGPGKNPPMAGTFVGGVSLQVGDRMQVSPLPEDRRKDLLPPPVAERNDVLGRAAGYPIAADAAGLAALDDADARANIAAMTPEQLARLQAELAGREKRLTARLAIDTDHLTGAQYRAAAPPDRKTWGDVLAEKVNSQPLVDCFAKLGQEEAVQLAEDGKEEGEGLKLAETAEKLKQLNDMREMLESGSAVLDGKTQEKFNQVLGLSAHDHPSAEEYLKVIRAQTAESLVPNKIVAQAETDEAPEMLKSWASVIKVGYETYEAYASYHEGTSWSDGMSRALPHVKEVLSEVPEGMKTLAQIAKAAGMESVEVVEIDAKLSVGLQVAEAGVDLSLTGIDMKVTNEGARRDHAANQVLLAEAIGVRDGDLARLEGTRKVASIAAKVAAQQ